MRRILHVSTSTNPALGTGLSINPSFASGPQTVTVRATDDSGGVSSASVTININTCTLPTPIVNITNPSGDISVIDTANDANGGYLEITLAGNASVSGTPITGANLVWSTDRADLQPGGPSSGSQQLGTGTSLPVRLYSDFCGNSTANSGRHIITLTATSAAGVARFVTRRIVVQQIC